MKNGSGGIPLTTDSEELRVLPPLPLEERYSTLLNLASVGPYGGVHVVQQDQKEGEESDGFFAGGGLTDPGHPWLHPYLSQSPKGFLQGRIFQYAPSRLKIEMISTMSLS